MKNIMCRQCVCACVCVHAHARACITHARVMCVSERAVCNCTNFNVYRTRSVLHTTHTTIVQVALFSTILTRHLQHLRTTTYSPQRTIKKQNTPAGAHWNIPLGVFYTQSTITIISGQKGRAEGCEQCKVFWRLDRTRKAMRAFSQGCSNSCNANKRHHCRQWDEATPPYLLCCFLRGGM